jgi:polysaccharide biosynthesis/export protein
VRTRLIILLFAFFAVAALFPPGLAAQTKPEEFITMDQKKIDPNKFVSTEALAALEASASREYLLGPGDVLEIVSLWPEISGEYVVGPDGRITVYLGGEVTVAGLTRKEAEERVKGTLSRFYKYATLTIKIKSYENNQITVLGRVTHPGAVKLRGQGRLLDAIAAAGVFPVQDKSAFPSTCTIFRGKDQVIWIDMQDLLFNANTRLNIALVNKDVLYIPDPQESNIYVFGEVAKPGAYEIRNVLTVLSAIGLAGGYTESAVISEVQLIRDRQKGGDAVTIDLEQMMADADLSKNYLLKNHDIVFVPRKGIAKFNYFLRMINPLTGFFLIQQVVAP